LAKNRKYLGLYRGIQPLLYASLAGVDAPHSSIQPYWGKNVELQLLLWQTDNVSIKEQKLLFINELMSDQSAIF